MRIWHENYTLEHVIALRENNLNRHLGIKFTEISDNSITATMPVEDFTRQSRGVLHGGASCVLAEALGSIASNLCLDMKKQKAFCFFISKHRFDAILPSASASTHDAPPCKTPLDCLVKSSTGMVAVIELSLISVNFIPRCLLRLFSLRAITCSSV